MNGSRSTLLYLLTVTGLALTPAVQADWGSDAVARLDQLYDDIRQDHGGSPKTVSLCSSVLFRVTWLLTGYTFYSINPKSQKSGGVSVSYLRKDTKYCKFAYGLKSGFIFDATFNNPKDHQDYAVFCSFPIDAAIDDRAQQGYTDLRRTPNSAEKSCQDTDVNTVEQRMASYRQDRGDRPRQCSLDVRDERNTATGPASHQSIRAMAWIADEPFTAQNKLRLVKREENPPKLSPILAVFYTRDVDLEGVRFNQVQWYRSIQTLLLIVDIRLSQTRQQDVQFAYDGREQVVHPTSERNACERYVESVTWVKRGDSDFRRKVMTLEVVPTDCGRKIQDDQADNSFDKLVVNHYLDSEWRDNPDNHGSNIGSMCRQLVCRFGVARSRPEWDLESPRSYTLDEDPIAKSCNNT